MESKKPERKPDSKAAKGKSPAEDRVEALTASPEAGKPEPGQASQRLRERKRAEEGSKPGKPALTEKQRIEARQRRRAQKRQRRPVTGNVLSRGVRATVNEVQRTFLFLGRSLLGGLDRIKPIGGVIVSGVAGLLRAIGRGLAALAGLVGIVLGALGKVLLALDRVVTTRRALIVIAFTAGVLLIVSQFLDFRAIEVGSGYADVQEITRAPRLETATPLDQHSLLLVVTGVIAILAAVGAAVTRRRITGLILVLSGAATLAVALLVDLPAGLDTADAELAFAGVNGVLLSGFWLQIGAGAVLLASGIGLVLDAPTPRQARVRQRHAVNSPATGSRA